MRSTRCGRRDGRGHHLRLESQSHLWHRRLLAHPITRTQAAGAGDDLAAGDAAREIHYEETNWKARPDVSPDGSRLVFSSYLGRSWHNLWVMPAAGGDAFPIAYGDWDQTYPRWSPDGTRVAFISNQSGSTDIDIERVPGGIAEPTRRGERHYLSPMARLHLELKDAQGRPASARVSVTDAAGRFYAPAGAWINADDSFDRTRAARRGALFPCARRGMGRCAGGSRGRGHPARLRAPLRTTPSDDRRGTGRRALR